MVFVLYKIPNESHSLWLKDEITIMGFTKKLMNNNNLSNQFERVKFWLYTHIYNFFFIFSDLGPQKEKKKKKEMNKAVLCQGEELLGEVEIYLEEKEKIEVKEIRKS